MQMYVGITDYDWFEFLKERNANEVNFWKPGTQPFKALNENDLFLFKLHAPQNYIVGGGFFVKYSFLPTYLAWNAFGEKNGTKSLRELNEAMDDETWFNAKKAVELGFADKVLFDKEEEKKPDKEPKQEEPEEGEEGDEGESTKEDGEEENEKKKKFPFQQNAYAYSAKKVTDSFLSKVTNTAPCEPQIPIDQLRKRLDLLKR